MRKLCAAISVGLLFLLIGADGPSTAPTRQGSLALDLGGGVVMEFILIHPGSFHMGFDKGDDDERPVHKVVLTKPYYLGKFDVTQQQWQAVMGDNPSEFKGPTNPVEHVSWDDCQEFLGKLEEKMPGQIFSLPTEAQWEYACRAGASTTYSFGDDVTKLGDYAWYSGNSGGATHPVGKKKSNAWGLYDMQGNVCQWCEDWYGDAYATGQAIDPTGPASGDLRVLRGESWVGIAADMRPAYRVGTPADYHNSHVGLRVVCLPVVSE